MNAQYNDRIRPIPREHETICEQFLLNLVASGHRVIDPNGVDVSQTILEHRTIYELRGER